MLAFVISVTLVRVLILILPLIGLVDIPGGRHIHTIPTPKGGGLGFILSFFITAILFNLSHTISLTGAMNLHFLGMIAGPVGLLTLIGYLDDRYDIHALVKLSGHIAVAVLSWLLGVRLDAMFGFPLSDTLSLILTIVWFVGFINAFNLIDGMDGLAAGLAIVASITLAVMFGVKGVWLNAVMLLILAGAVGGFLRYNFYPARIFMGDMGSMFLGYIFAATGILASNKLATTSAIFIPILILGVPFFDVLLAIWRRSVKKILNRQSNGSNHERIMGADKEHLHHRLLAVSKNQGKAVLLIYMLALFFSFLAFLLFFLEDASLGLLLTMILIAVYISMRQLINSEVHQSSKALIRGFSKPSRSTLVGLSHPIFDLLVLFVTYWGIDRIYIVKEGLTLSSGMMSHTSLNLIVTFLIFISFVVSGIYNRFWLRATPEDYMRLVGALLLGHVLSVVFLYFSLEEILFWRYLKRLIFLGTFVSLVVIAERIFLRFLYMKLHTIYLDSNNHENIKHVILYGAGVRCQYYLQEIATNIEQDPTRVVGLLDDNPGLWNKNVYGQKVLGNINDLTLLAPKKNIDTVIITTRTINPENIEKAKEICKKHGIKLIQWKFVEEIIVE
jgi:UDP-N-acetylmuramyl pentapeptide phosphotransferase/UDP-N-acetylglucosamine-1-phosphate transferase